MLYRFKQNFPRIIIFFISIVVGVSCRIKGAHSTLNVTNGVAAGDEFPEVVQIFSYNDDNTRQRCMGTFISPRLMLTAAHCLYHFHDNKKTQKVSSVAFTHPKTGKTYETKTFSAASRYDNSKLQTLPNDLGVVLFDEECTTDYVKNFDPQLFGALPPKGAELHFVGMGIVDWDRDDVFATEKLKGVNIISGYRENVALVAGVKNADVASSQGIELGQQASLGSGDSGAGVFVKKADRFELVGVASASSANGGQDGFRRSAFVMLHHDRSRQNLREVLKNVGCTK